MTDEKKIETTETEVPSEARRTFVKTAAKAAIAAPAVVLLLDAATKPASAVPVYTGGEGPIIIVSDLRLKRDISPVDTLPSGIPLHSFRYWNDDRTFIGVMAQDLLADERFRHAVSTDRSGYHVVDLAALGLGVSGSRAQLLEAGRAALRAARPLTN